MKEYKKIIIIGFFTSITIIVIIIINGLLNKNNSNQETTTTINQTTTASKIINKIIVEIKGEVYYPGIYTFYDDEVLLNDVINMAGGLTSNADYDSINRAMVVSNHSVIVIEKKNSSVNINSTNITSNKININLATKEELMELEGIGEVKATKIVNYRKNNGFFTSIDDLVSNGIITEALFEKIKDYITV